MRRKDKKFKIQYKVDDKILSLRFETIQDFLETVFPKNNNPLSPTNDTELLSATWHKQPLFEKSYKLGEVKTLLKDFNPTKLFRKETYSIEEVRDKVKDVLFEKDKRLAKVDFDGDYIDEKLRDMYKNLHYTYAEIALNYGNRIHYNLV